MTDTSLIACPACAAAPAATAAVAPRPDGPLRRVELSLPGIHCAACIAGVERTLLAEPGVAAARVNLTLKRAAATVEDAPGAEARLIAALGARGYEARPLDSAALEATRQDAEGRALLARIGVAGFASMNVMLLSIAVWSGATATTRDLMHWLSAAITLPAVAFSAWPFFRSALIGLRGRRLDMDLPISIAILMAAAVSLRETILSGPRAYYEAAIMLTFFLLVGRYLAHVTRAAARSAAAELAALEVRTAERLAPDGRRETVPLDALRPGDAVAVAPGARVPADGTVTHGRSEIDPSLLTGETIPEAVAPGATLRAGTLNLTGPLTLRVEALGEDALLGRIAALVEAAERSRSRYASLAERAATLYAPFVLLLAAAALAWWGATTGDWRLASNVAAAVLIVTCPCGLGLAVPAVLTAASGRLFRAGVLLKDGTALERLAEVDTVVFDKTGTLTTGRPVLTNAAAIPPDAFAAAAALAAGSAHPLARGDRRGRQRPARRGRATSPSTPASAPRAASPAGPSASAAPNGSAPTRTRRSPPPGSGSATPRRSPSPSPTSSAPTPPPPWRRSRTPASPSSCSPATPRPRSRPSPTGSASRPGWRAPRRRRRSPASTALEAEGRRVLMVGDGLNDAAALAAAHVSMSPASAVDASRSAADLILLGDRLDRVASSWRLARTARRRVLENFALAFAYNLVTVPVAFMGLVTPLFAAITMSASSLVVCLNALRLDGPEEFPPGRPPTPSRPKGVSYRHDTGSG